jgi:F-type H+-transporting ATPase subunit c
MEIEGSLNAIGYGLSAIGGAIGVGLVFYAYITGVARQPEAQRVLQPIAFLGLAFTEALAILGLVLAFIL